MARCEPPSTRPASPNVRFQLIIVGLGYPKIAALSKTLHRLTSGLEAGIRTCKLAGGAVTFEVMMTGTWLELGYEHNQTASHGLRGESCTHSQYVEDQCAQGDYKNGDCFALSGKKHSKPSCALVIRSIGFVVLSAHDGRVHISTMFSAVRQRTRCAKFEIRVRPENGTVVSIADSYSRLLVANGSPLLWRRRTTRPTTSLNLASENRTWRSIEEGE